MRTEAFSTPLRPLPWLPRLSISLRTAWCSLLLLQLYLAWPLQWISTHHQLSKPAGYFAMTGVPSPLVLLPCVLSALSLLGFWKGLKRLHTPVDLKVRMESAIPSFLLMSLFTAALGLLNTLNWADPQLHRYDLSWFINGSLFQYIISCISLPLFVTTSKAWSCPQGADGVYGLLGAGLLLTNGQKQMPAFSVWLAPFLIFSVVMMMIAIADAIYMIPSVKVYKRFWVLELVNLLIIGMSCVVASVRSIAVANLKQWPKDLLFLFFAFVLGISETRGVGRVLGEAASKRSLPSCIEEDGAWMSMTVNVLFYLCSALFIWPSAMDKIWYWKEPPDSSVFLKTMSSMMMVVSALTFARLCTFHGILEKLKLQPHILRHDISLQEGAVSLAVDSASITPDASTPSHASSSSDNSHLFCSAHVEKEDTDWWKDVVIKEWDEARQCSTITMIVASFYKIPKIILARWRVQYFLLLGTSLNSTIALLLKLYNGHTPEIESWFNLTAVNVAGIATSSLSVLVCACSLLYDYGFKYYGFKSPICDRTFRITTGAKAFSVAFKVVLQFSSPLANFSQIYLFVATVLSLLTAMITTSRELGQSHARLREKTDLKRCRLFSVQALQLTLWLLSKVGSAFLLLGSAIVNVKGGKDSDLLLKIACQALTLSIASLGTNELARFLTDPDKKFGVVASIDGVRTAVLLNFLIASVIMAQSVWDLGFDLRTNLKQALPPWMWIVSYAIMAGVLVCDVSLLMFLPDRRSQQRPQS